MTLLHVTTVPYTLRAFFRGQAAYLREYGIVVHATSSPGPELGAFGAAEDVPVYPVPMERRISPLADARAVVRMVRLLRALRPDIVHAHTPKGGLVGMIAAKVCRVPVRVYHVHGLPLVTATGLRRRLLLASEWVSCACAHRVLCVSGSIREVAVESRLCHPDKLAVLGSGSFGGVDAVGAFSPATYPVEIRDRIRSRYGIPASATVLGFVGRIVADKGIGELAAAWRAVRAERPDLHLLVVGPFERGDPVAAEDEALLRGDERVHLPGHVDDVPEHLLAMDLFLMPSHREGFGMSNLEAGAMGLPVVSTRIPGCVDSVQDGVTGTLVPPGDAPALASAIEGYLTDPDLGRRHGEAGRRRALDDFRPETKWAELEAEYRRLLAER